MSKTWSPVARAAAAALLLVPAAARAQVTLTQEITLGYGWNAVYLELAPLGTPEEVFSEWPVDMVGLYDPAAFLPSRQFGEEHSEDSIGISLNPVLTWYRAYPEASDVSSIPAGTVALAFSTNASATKLLVRGTPAAPRATWHVTGAKDPYNCLGVSLQPGATTTAPEYVDGFPGSTRQEYYRFSGKRTNAAPLLSRVYASTKISDGEVLLIPSDRISDWSGVLHVSPMDGLDFGLDGTMETLTVRNDGAAARTVAVDLLRPADAGESGLWGDHALPDAAVKVRDASDGATNMVWRAALGGAGRRVASKRLAPGEKWLLEFGLDRTELPAAVKGDSFGALLRVTDTDGGSKMRADVPFRCGASGADAARTAWPGGLWVAEVAFDRVRGPGDASDTETGGTAKVRLPVHIDTNGTIRLLQRVVAAGTTDSEGTWSYRLYAGKAEIPATATAATRISAVTLPTETPVIEAESGSGVAGGGVSFAFTVAADGATSPLRHPLHPQHDGLQWDFSTPAPSGDDFNNYKGDVKPETFSVSCRIEVELDMGGDEASWNPEGTKGGTCRWTFSNLMRQGDVAISGPMTIKRVSTIGEIELK